MGVTYPLRWFSDTFTSKARTEELLRPEYSNGNLTKHDYESSVKFLSVKHGCLPFAYATFGAALSLAWSRYRRWGKRSVSMSIVAGTAGGLVYGLFRRSLSHMHYHHDLEDLDGYARAIENINLRTGGIRPLGMAEVANLIKKGKPAGRVPADTPTSDWETPDSAIEYQKEDAGGLQKESVIDSHREQPVDHEREQTRVAPGQGWSPTQTHVQSPSSAPKSTWDEIRATNARGASNSSWDTLRQTHERAKIDPLRSSTNEGDDDRAREQAAFDAMLDAERKRADSIAGNS